MKMPTMKVKVQKWYVLDDHIWCIWWISLLVMRDTYLTQTVSSGKDLLTYGVECTIAHHSYTVEHKVKNGKTCIWLLHYQTKT